MNQHKQTAKKTKRPVGRPRADGRPHLTEGDVFGPAAKLIARHGFAGTSMRALAAELKVTPASLFHLFKNKEDLLNRLICFAATPSIAFYERIRARKEKPGVLLYKSLYEEVLLVASADRAVPALFYLPELAHEGFGPAQTARRTMIGHYEMLIRQGVTEGMFEPVDPALTAEQFFQLTETSILAGPGAQKMPPDAQACATAKLCLRAILKKTSKLEAIAREAEALDDHIDVRDFTTK